MDLVDVNHVLPLNKQKGVWDKNWRDPSQDLNGSSRIKVDKDKYLTLLNQKRQENGAPPLKYNSKLEQSAAKRGEVILKFDDLSFEATKSGYTMVKAMAEVGYSNIVWGEAQGWGFLMRPNF